MLQYKSILYHPYIGYNQAFALCKTNWCYSLSLYYRRSLFIQIHLPMKTFSKCSQISLFLSLLLLYRLLSYDFQQFFACFACNLVILYLFFLFVSIGFTLEPFCCCFWSFLLCFEPFASISCFVVVVVIQIYCSHFHFSAHLLHLSLICAVLNYSVLVFLSSFALFALRSCFFLFLSFFIFPISCPFPLPVMVMP